MGTVNSARVCGFPGEIGALKPGMKADLILIDLNEMLEDPWISPNLNIVEIFIHRAMGRHVNTVIVGGQVVMENRKILTLDVNDLYAEVRKAASKGIREEQKIFAKNLQKIKPYYHAWYADWAQSKYEPFYILNSKI
jgi:formylmethanofuran dehydrogenase subunit A